MRVVVFVYRDNARVHCSTLGAKPHSVLATVAETPAFFENVADWLASTFEKAGYPIPDAKCEAKIVRVEDEKIEFELVFRKKQISPPAPWKTNATMDVARDEYGNVDFRVPPTK